MPKVARYITTKSKNLAVLYVNNDFGKGGLDMIKKAVEAKPDDGYIVDSLGWAFYRMGKFEESVTELERAVQLRAGDATINDHLGDAYWRVGRKLEAVYQWNRALISEGDDVNRDHIKDKVEKGLPPLDPNATTADRSAPEPAAPVAPAPENPDKKS